MSDQRRRKTRPERIGVISRASSGPRTPEEARQTRSTAMLGWGVVALVVGGLLIAGSGSAIGLLLGILGVGLVVGGLVVRS